jgi:hypothetical protein
MAYLILLPRPGIVALRNARFSHFGAHKKIGRLAIVAWLSIGYFVFMGILAERKKSEFIDLTWIYTCTL